MPKLNAWDRFQLLGLLFRQWILPAEMTTGNETGSGKNGMLAMRQSIVSFTIRLARYADLIVLGV